MQLGVLDRVREIATMPEADLMSLTPSEIQTYLNRARRLARETLKILEDDAVSPSPAFKGIALGVSHFPLSNDLD